MSEQTKKLKVTIFGDSYNLISDDTDEHITKTAVLVDSAMQDIAKRSGLTDAKRIAVLAALQVASKLILAENALSSLEQAQISLEKVIDKSLRDIESSF